MLLLRAPAETPEIMYRLPRLLVALVAAGPLSVASIFGASCATGCSRTADTPAPAPAKAEPEAPSTPPAKRAPDVPYDPSPPEVVTLMLRLADVRPGDVVYDLGCGDGRIVIAAVERPNVRGVCVDIDPERIAESRANAERAGVADRITFLTQDLFETDIREATVVMLFLWPKVNLELRPKLLRELAPGARVVSHWHDMGDWQPDDAVSIDPDGRTRSVYLWRITGKPGTAAGKE